MSKKEEDMPYAKKNRPALCYGVFVNKRLLLLVKKFKGIVGIMKSPHQIKVFPLYIVVEVVDDIFLGTYYIFMIDIISIKNVICVFVLVLKMKRVINFYFYLYIFS
jgi:hypothetical protein